VSTDPRRAHFPACRHPVSVPLSCAYCRHCAIATAVPLTCCPHTPPPGRGHVLPGQTCTHAHTHPRGRSPAYVPNQRRRAVPRRSSFFVPLPSAHHQFCVAAMAVPSAFGTHTNARNRGAEPLLHLSVTVLDVPPCRRREPQRTGARVSVEPSTPIRTFLAALTLNTASPKSAHILSLCRRHARAVGFVSPRGQAADVCTSANACTRGVEPLCSPCPTHVRTPARVRLGLPSRTSAHARTHARKRVSTPAWTP
jgi:hypothetical protein